MPTDFVTKPEGSLSSRLADHLSSLAVGGIVVGGGVSLVFATLLIGALAMLFLAFAAAWLGKWLIAWVIGAVIVGIWVHKVAHEPKPPVPQPLRRRMAGIHGDACYATLAETEARGLIPASFDASVYLGAFINWFTPLDAPWERTARHVG